MSGSKRAQYWKIKDVQDPRIQEAGRIVREGGLVAFPTETVYGLGANGLDGQAASRIFAAKHRPMDNPLILHVATLSDAKALSAEWSPQAQLLAEKLWPGPLTMIVPAAAHVPVEVTAGLSTVAIRFPKHPVALALIEAAGVPIAAPSANRSGRPSPTLAEHVVEDLGDQIDVILDGGSCQVGLESTIIDMSIEPPAILRPGEITLETLKQILGTVIMDSPLPGLIDEAFKSDSTGKLTQGSQTSHIQASHASQVSKVPKAPGMKYRHYAPKAPLTLLVGKPSQVADFVIEQWAQLQKQEEQQEPSLPIASSTSDEAVATVAFLLSDETWSMLGEMPKNSFTKIYGRNMGSQKRPRVMGRLLYDELRRCDQEAVTRIFVEGCSTKGYGAAVMNRLNKAAGNQRIDLDPTGN